MIYLFLIGIIFVFVALPISLYVGSGYTYQNNPEARKDLIEHM